MERLIESDWLQHAKALDEGRRTYVDHKGCGSGTGKTLVVSSDDTGWSAQCFRCGLRGYVAYGIRPLADLSVIRKKEVLFENACTVALPEDFTYEVPIEYAVWFAKNGIFKETCRAYSFGWSASMQRIILPIYDKHGTLTFMQARAVEGWRKPKYLNLSAVPKASICFRAGEQPSVRTCCITEDIASAVRLGVHIPSISTLGTSLSDEQASQIATDYDCVIMWYDADAAGRSGDIKAQRKLRMLGLNCYSICTPKDPKSYSNNEIITILTKGALDGRYRPHYPTDYEGARVIRKDVYELTAGMFR